MKECQNWLHVNLACEICLKEALRSILHLKKHGLPEDGRKLYKRMVQFKTSHERELRKVIHDTQWNIICPASGVSNSKDWDITIIKVVIQYEVKIQAPIGSWGWEAKTTDLSDTSLAAFVCRAKDLRNVIKHSTVSQLQDPYEYANVVSSMKTILNGLGYKHMKRFNELNKVHRHTDEVMNVLKVKFHELNEEMSETMKECDKNHQDIRKHRQTLDELTKRFDEVDNMLFQVSNELKGFSKDFDRDIRFIQNNIQLTKGNIMQNIYYHDKATNTLINNIHQNLAIINCFHLSHLYGEFNSRTNRFKGLRNSKIFLEVLEPSNTMLPYIISLLFHFLYCNASL